MNRHAQNVIGEFKQAKNRAYLYKALSAKFQNNPIVDDYLVKHFMSSFNHFTHRMEQEIYTSVPVAGLSITTLVCAYNRQFLLTTAGTIHDNVLAQSNVVNYRVSDGLATSRYSERANQRSANDILKSWESNPNRGIQAREDHMGATGMGGGNNISNSKYANIVSDHPNRSRLCDPPTLSGDLHPSRAGREGFSARPVPNCEENMATGITFCDQSMENTDHHVTAFYTPMMRRMNDVKPEDAHMASAFGEASAESDQRLLSRRIFRSNEAGEENGIARYEQRLYHRHLDTEQINEGLRGTERDCVVLGHDMSSLYRRVDHKRQAKARFEQPPSDFHPSHPNALQGGRYGEGQRY